MQDCPKCRSRMTAGTAFASYSGYRLPIQWVDGMARKSIWTGLSLGGKKPVPVTSRRCGKCGFVELYAETRPA